MKLKPSPLQGKTCYASDLLCPDGAEGFLEVVVAGIVRIETIPHWVLLSVSGTNNKPMYVPVGDIILQQTEKQHDLFEDPQAPLGKIIKMPQPN